MDETFYLNLLALAQEAEMHGTRPPDITAILARANVYAQFCSQAVDDGGDAHEPYDGDEEDALEREQHEIQRAIWRRDRQQEMRDTQRRGDSDGQG